MPTEECWKARGEQEATTRMLRESFAELKSDLRERDAEAKADSLRIYEELRDLCKTGHDRITKLENRMNVLEAKLAAYVAAIIALYTVFKEIVLPIWQGK